jgi:hypothetical protein
LPVGTGHAVQAGKAGEFLKVGQRSTPAVAARAGVGFNNFPEL